LRARGGFIVDLKWDGGKPRAIRLTHPAQADASVAFADHRAALKADGTWRDWP
jgi:hypothetical protein